MKFSCGKLAVPLDYSQPDGETADVFVVRVRSDSQSQRLGSLLVDPGGPGGSGVNLAAGLVSALSEQVLDRFDVVGFDPRGIGLSDPVQCISDTQKDQLSAANPDVRTAARSGPGPVSLSRGRQVLRHQVRLGPGPLQHRRDRPRHGPDPAGGRRRQAQLPGLLLRHPARGGLRPPVPH